MSDSPSLPLTDFAPRPALVTRTTVIEQPCHPVFDAHNHLGPVFGGGWTRRPAHELLTVLDAAGVTTLVDLDGGWGDSILQAHLDHFKHHAPDRFIHFAGVDWDAWPTHGDRFGDWAARHLEQQVKWGAQGLKIWKNFGLHVCDQHNQRVAVDDPRLDPLWAAAGELGLPVLAHVADPVAFFQPLDPTNERWEELHAHPDWHFPSPPFPTFDSILTAFASVVLRHPNTTFIGAHVGCYSENLAWVADLLDRAPNFYVDISARIAELGRQPYSARRFVLRYADRILFGTDSPASLDSYRLYYRFLETDDEYFPYSTKASPPQGRWNIYGLYLPGETLAKVYHHNAARLFSHTKPA